VQEFLLEGDVDWSDTRRFALAEYEREEGYTLICRAHGIHATSRSEPSTTTKRCSPRSCDSGTSRPESER